MFKNAIFFPHRAGQQIRGVEMTPFFLKDILNTNINQIDTMVSYNNELYFNLYNLYKNNVFINGPRVNIGGDHSMSIATLADSMRRYSNLKVIWMDAHCDINTYETSISKNYHGMPLSILTGLEKKSSLNFTKEILNFKNILYIGVRDIDPFEKEVMEKYNIENIKVKNIHNNREQIINKINNFVKNNPIHFSFDVDVLDPLVMPCTGTPVEQGLQLNDCKIIIDTILKKNVISLDIAELNVGIGNAEEKSKSIKNLTYLFKNYLF